MRQDLTSYLLDHLTNSTTLTAYIQWYSTRRFRNLLLSTSSEDPLLSYPTRCRRARVSRTPVISISRPTAQTPTRHSLSNDVVSSNYPVQLTAYENISRTVTSVVKCSMLTLLQPLPRVSFPPSVRVSFPSKAADDASGSAPNPHVLLEANAAKPETTGYAQYPPPIHAISSH